MMTIAIAILILTFFGVAYGVWSVGLARRQFAAMSPREVHSMRQAGSVTFWFCQAAALFFVLYGVWTFSALGHRLAPLVWLLAAMFCVGGIWVRHLTHSDNVT